MAEKSTDHSLVAEAANPGTSPERLKELVSHPFLRLTIATNPATPDNVLDSLSKENDPAIRRRVVKNPNTPLAALLDLSWEFPHEFLANPVLSLMAFNSLNFLHHLSNPTWFQLLRCQEVPKAWLQWIVSDTTKAYRQEIGWYQLGRKIEDASWKHIAMSGELPADWQVTATSEVKKLQAQLQTNSSTLLSHLLIVNPELLVKNIKRLLPEEQATIVNHYSALSSQVLASLAQDLSDTYIPLQCGIARHCQAPREVLVEMASQRRDPLVRKAVASNPRTPASLLHILAQDTQAMVRTAVAHHHLTALEDLSLLTSASESEVRVALAGNSYLDETLFWHLSNDPSPTVRGRLARNRSIPAHLLDRLARDPVIEVRANVARNLRLPGELFSLLCADPEAAVALALASNSQIPVDLLWQFSRHAVGHVRQAAASNPCAPLAMLEQLIEDMDAGVRRGIACNPHATPHMLARLASLNDATIHVLLLRHKHTPVEILTQIVSQYPSYLLRDRVQALVSNPHTPLNLLKQILESTFFDLLPGIANHPGVRHTRQQIIRESLLTKAYQNCVNNNVFRLDFILLTDVDLPADLLELFARSSAWEIRFLAAQHFQISRCLLEELIDDGHQYVRAVARVTLAQRFPRVHFLSDKLLKKIDMEKRI